MRILHYFRSFPLFVLALIIPLSLLACTSDEPSQSASTGRNAENEMVTLTPTEPSGITPTATSPSESSGRLMAKATTMPTPTMPTPTRNIAATRANVIHTPTPATVDKVMDGATVAPAPTIDTGGTPAAPLGTTETVTTDATTEPAPTLHIDPTPSPSPVPKVPLSTVKDALTSLYDHTDGSRWRRNDNWLTDAPIDQWYGLYTEEDGRLTGLSLGSNNLKGEIPPELGKLINLELLDLSNNRLEGEIPPELSELSNLVEFVVEENRRLTGHIPSQLARRANRGDRIRLRFSDTELSWPPDKTRDALLSLYHALGGPKWPDERQWRVLHQGFWEWEGVITDHDGRVIELDLTGRGEIPPEVGDLDDLEVLRINGGWLGESTAAGIGRLRNLQRLHLYVWPLPPQLPPRGVILPELGHLTSLRTLSISAHRQPGKIPPELGNLTNLEVLGLFGNDLSGEIPPELGNLSRLRVLNLGNNQLSGHIPPELGKLDQLVIMDLNSNQLMGRIPQELEDIPVFWAGNQLETASEISQHDENIVRSMAAAVRASDMNWGSDQPLGQWSSVAVNSNGRVNGLKIIRMRDSPPIPELGQLSELTHLSLGSELQGAIPPEWGELSQLRFLRVRLGGRGIAPELGELSQLRHLELRDVGRGEIPPELGNLTNLQELYIIGWGDPGLRGRIPAELGKLTDLRRLHIRRTEIEGEIPVELANLTNLENLNLSGNELSGDVPPELGSLTNLRSLMLRDNNLNQVPWSFSDLTNLRYADFSGGTSTGCIPPEWAGRLARRYFQVWVRQWVRSPNPYRC